MIRFYNGRILSFGNGLSINENEVWTYGQTICYVGPKREDMPEFEREIDLKGDILMPGFKNAHTHSAMTFVRSFADDLPLEQWLYEKIFPREAKLTDETIYYCAKLANMEYLTSGITSSFDMYFHNDAYVQANIDMGFRTAIVSAMNNFDKDYHDVEQEYLKFNGMNDLISYHIGFHAEYTTCMERMEYIASLAEKYSAPVFVHNAETKTEVEGCIERYGVTPTVLFDRLGMYRYGGGGFHCVYMTDADIEVFKNRGLWVVTNPASNLKLASGIAPICRFMSEGINIAIGTDGPASNNALDMFREMFLVTALAKYRENDASACDANRVLEMACVGGARAMGLNDCDDIAVGKKADLIVIDLSRPNMHPFNNLSKNIVYSGSKENVRLTMVGGRILYENGEFFLDEPADKIYREAERVTKPLL